MKTVEKAVKAKVSEMTKDINRKVARRGTTITNILRSTEQEVLDGNRSGRVYKKPDTYGKSRTKSTRKLLKDYGHKLRGGQLYRASAAGEAPARRTGALRLQWSAGVEKIESSNKTEIVAYIESNTPYAQYLEEGTAKMQPRPYMEKIKEKAEPEICKILNEDYS